MELNKKRLFAACILLAGLLTESGALAQTKYWVRFKDKNNSPYSVSNPSAFLSARSIARRTNQNIQVDMTDIPVNQTYINQVNATGAVVFQRSKWFNAAIVVISDPAQLSAVNSLTCVLSSSPVARRRISTQHDEVLPVVQHPVQRVSGVSGAFNYGPGITQISQINLDCMHNQGYRGQGMFIAVIDDGFNNVDNNPVFDSLFNEGRVLGTRDIVAGNASVYEDDSHGAMVLSLLAGNSPGNLIGTAPKATYYLIRSEDVNTEKLIEENNWVVAAELADSLGADIITTSLGYSTFDNSSQNHTYADLNGRTSVASIGSTMAARKGILPLNAAGNEGQSFWHYIGVPADADSILTVGSVNSGGIHSGFSSVGPTADGRIKPDVSTMGEGTYVCQPGGFFTAGNGTSFSCPVMAGAAACLWQAHPNKANMEILNVIRNTSSKYANPDNEYGWGIPDMCLAHIFLNTPTSVAELSRSKLNLFPDPARNKISFRLDEEVRELSVHDMLGKAVPVSHAAAGDTHTIGFGDQMPAGVYFISIQTGSELLQSKFIKE